MEITEKKSDYLAGSEQEFRRLSYQDDLLIPCTITEDQETLSLCYDCTRLKPATTIRQLRQADKLVFLIAAAKLQRLTGEYTVDLSPENLWYDIALMPQLLRRDIAPADNAQAQEDFVCQYKSLIGYTLQKKYTYRDYYTGGLDLLGDKGLLGKVRACRSVSDITDVLIAAHEQESKILQEQMETIPKRKYRFTRAAAVVSIVLALLLAGSSGYLALYQLPLQNQLVAASNAYMHKDYETLIDTLQNTPLDRMPYETKYMLASGYIASEGLSDEQKKNIMTTITLQSNQDLFDFWIDLGQLHYEQAINTAKKLGDDEYLLYAYMKEKLDVESDTELSGDEKQSKLDAIDDELDKLEKKYQEENPTASSAAP